MSVARRIPRRPLRHWMMSVLSSSCDDIRRAASDEKREVIWRLWRTTVCVLIWRVLP